PMGTNMARTGPTAVRFHDPITIIFADVPVMKQFLTTEPVQRSKPGTAAAAPAEGTPQPGGPPGGPPGFPGRGRGGSMGGPPGAPGLVGDPGGPPGGGQASEGEQASPNQYAYLSVNPDMKAMLDRIEAKGVMVSMATDNNRAIKGHLRNAVQLLPPQDSPVAG